MHHQGPATPRPRPQRNLVPPRPEAKSNKAARRRRAPSVCGERGQFGHHPADGFIGIPPLPRSIFLPGHMDVGQAQDGPKTPQHVALVGGSQTTKSQNTPTDKPRRSKGHSEPVALRLEPNPMYRGPVSGVGEKGD